MDIRGASSLGRDSLGAARVALRDGEAVLDFSCIDFLLFLSRPVLRIAESVSSASSIWERFVLDLFCANPTCDKLMYISGNPLVL